LPGLDYIDGGKGTDLRFSALVTLRSIELAPIVQKEWIVLYEAIHQISSVQVKMMGTAVGNLCVATPASDVAPALIALAARVKITGADSDRVIPVEHFFVAAGKTILEPDEIITEVAVPSLPTGTGGAFVKLAKTAADIAKVNAAVTVTVADERCKEVRIALRSVAPTPIRVTKAEEILQRQKLSEKTIARAAEAAAESVTPITDVRSTAIYRKEMVRVLVKDALEKAVARANA